MHHRVAGLPRRLHYRPLGKQLVDGGNGAQAGAHLIGHVLAIAHVQPFKTKGRSVGRSSKTSRINLLNQSVVIIHVLRDLFHANGVFLGERGARQRVPA